MPAIAVWPGTCDDNWPVPVKQPSTSSHPDGLRAFPEAHLIGEFLDRDWYRERYPDIAASDTDVYHHFIHYGAAEKRDPNRFFDSAWYIEHYPDVAASGLHPLLHYARAGAAELRNPHPRFDAVYYVEQHPEAAANPLLHHLRVGMARGYLTEQPIDIADYLPSEKRPLQPPRGIFVDVIIRVHRGAEGARRLIRSVLTERQFPLARVIVIDDHAAGADLGAWLQDLVADGEVHLIRNPRRLGFAASANLGMEAAMRHDVVILDGDTEVPAGWLRRLAAHAYSQPNIATVSPFSDHASITGYMDDGASPAVRETPARLDALCQTVNAGRSASTAVAMPHCIYIRRAALLAAGVFDGKRSGSDDAVTKDFCSRASTAGWEHRLACDTFVPGNGSRPVGAQAKEQRATRGDVIPFQFAVTAAHCRESGLPVILMITHSLGGGVRRHIDGLVERYRDTAHVLLLEGTTRGAALSVPAAPGDPVLTLPADRVDDLVSVLRSTNLSRVHIHHLLQMDIDIRALIHRLGVPFDVTVHDYYAICPQINLLRWSEGLYCGEPGPAACNACIADRSSHGARDIASWRRDRAWQFLAADRVICPSVDVKTRLDRYGMGDRATVVPHEQQTGSFWTTRVPESEPLLRIGLLGVLANHKGARAVAEVAEAAAPGTIELELIGHLEDNFPKPAAKLIRATGKYQEGDLPDLLKRIDPQVFWFPAPWPETFSYTLSVAIDTGLPIVASDIGSFTERLAGRPLTWLVDHRASAQDWLAVFEAVRTTLRDRAIGPRARRSRTTSDFYADHYLSPGSGRVPALAAPRRRIAIVPERFASGGLTPCGYIRLLQPLDHLAIGGGFDIILVDAETVFDYDADVIVTQRYAIPDVDMADRLAAHARRTGAKLLYDLDDDLLNIPGGHPDASALRPLAKVVRRMLTAADAVWVSTSGLAERLAPIRPDAIVMENRLDERIWTHTPGRNAYWDDPIRILCMGTTTHDRDFAMIEPALVRLKAEYGDRIVIDVLGMTHSELPAGLNRIGPSTHASRSYPGFVNWLTSVRPRWHIGLAPLLDTQFNRSKSPIKAMDYAAMGLAVLASDTPVYRGSIADGPAGQLVVNDPRAWHAALDWMIRDQGLRARTGARAREAFLAQATLASQADTRLAAWTRLLPDRRPQDDLRGVLAALTIQNDTSHTVTRKRRHSGRGR
jgi:glycosyltransferase involved in cell wall biosynthesis